jgi:hypothetical protein
MTTHSHRKSQQDKIVSDTCLQYSLLHQISSYSAPSNAALNIGRSKKFDLFIRGALLIKIPNHTGLIKIPNHTGLIKIPNHTGLIKIPNHTGLIKTPNHTGLIKNPNHTGL